MHDSANQTRGKQLDTHGSCPTFTGLTTPLGTARNPITQQQGCWSLQDATMALFSAVLSQFLPSVTVKGGVQIVELIFESSFELIFEILEK